MSIRLLSAVLFAIALLLPTALSAADVLIIDPGKTEKRRPRLGDVPVGAARPGARREVPRRVTKVDTRRTKGALEAEIKDRGREFHISATEESAGQKFSITVEFEMHHYVVRKIRRGRVERHEWKHYQTTNKQFPIEVVVRVGDLPRPVVALGEEMFLPLPGRAVWHDDGKKKRTSRAAFRGGDRGYHIRGVKLGKISNTNLPYRIGDTEHKQSFLYEVVEKPTELPAATLAVGGTLTIAPEVAAGLELTDLQFLVPYKHDPPNIASVQTHDGALVIHGFLAGKTRLWLACVGNKSKSSYAVQCYVDVTVAEPAGTPTVEPPGHVPPARIIDTLHRHLVGGESKEDLCAELQVSTEEFDRWIERLFTEGSRIFES